jgi:hypothetical protein
MLFPRRPPDQSGLEVRTLYRLTRPCFSGRKTGAGTCLHIALPPHGLAGTPRSGSAQSFHAAAASHQHEVDQRHLSRFWLVFFAPKSPISGQECPHPQPQPAGGVVIFGTLQGAISGTQTHSRRTGSKLGRLHRARQGLVRVSESNTKYGGKRRITGGGPRLRCPQVSVSPQGFPSEKK